MVAVITILKSKGLISDNRKKNQKSKILDKSGKSMKRELKNIEVKLIGI